MHYTSNMAAIGFYIYCFSNQETFIFTFHVYGDLAYDLVISVSSQCRWFLAWLHADCMISQCGIWRGSLRIIKADHDTRNTLYRVIIRHCMIVHNDYLHWTRSSVAKKNSSRTFASHCNKAYTFCKLYAACCTRNSSGRSVLLPSCTVGRRRNGTVFTFRASYGNPTTESSCNKQTSMAHHENPGFSSSRPSEVQL